MSHFDYAPILTDDYFHGVPLKLDHQPNALMGTALVEDTYRITEVEEQPVRYSNEPIIVPDKPWETFIQAPYALFDEEDGLYKMWYSTRHYNPDYQPDWETNLEAGNCGKFVCYAESKDGVHYIKPELDIVPFGQWKKNNIVFADSDVGATMGTVILNPDRSIKDHRFIMVWSDGYGVRISYSPDGLRWGDTTEVTNIPMDTSLVLAFDKSRSVWQLFCRPAIFAKHEKQPAEKDVCPNLNYRRNVCLMESPDLVSWSIPRLIFHADENCVASQADNVAFCTVGNCPIVFVHLFPVRNIDECLNQYMLPYLATGEDLYHLTTLPDPKPVIGRGSIGSFDENMVNIHGAPMNLFDDGRSYFYYCGDSKRSHMSVGLLSFENDRYCARYGDEAGGWLLTREFIVNGSSIEINAEILPYGEITAEILDGDHGTTRGGRRIVGYEREIFDPMTVGSLAHTLSWNGNSDISPLKGRAVYLRFSIKNAKLYSFTVKE